MIDRMTEYNVLIDQDVTQEKLGSIFLPQDRQEKDKHQQTKGVIVLMGAKAFEDIETEATKPRVGDRVLFAQHAGTFYRDGDKEFRIVKDKDIVAVLV